METGFNRKEFVDNPIQNDSTFHAGSVGGSILGTNHNTPEVRNKFSCSPHNSFESKFGNEKLIFQNTYLRNDKQEQ